MNEEEQQNGWSRREWLLASAASAGALWLGGAKAAIAKGVARDDVPADLTPAQALQRLLDGNKRFASGKPKGPHRSLARVHELAANQSPFAAILSCADSRVPVEILFDQGFGDLFVVRNAGNVATTEEFASLEFGTLVLGAKVLLVLGLELRRRQSLDRGRTGARPDQRALPAHPPRGKQRRRRSRENDRRQRALSGRDPRASIAGDRRTDETSQAAGRWRRLRSRHGHRHADLAVSAPSVPGVKLSRRQVVRIT